MFLEVYAVNLNNYSEDTEVSKVPENRRLVEMTGARIRYSDKFPDRAEIILANDEILLAAGSYDDLVGRIEATDNYKIARVDG
ncbi:hypothetical protein P4E94_05105 [Pontiellaceae bacterium B12219]|nr:hypothetical protein [Pontiellaceae bacterium B12219]